MKGVIELCLAVAFINLITAIRKTKAAHVKCVVE